jgi:hypothetical protein
MRPVLRKSCGVALRHRLLTQGLFIAHPCSALPQVLLLTALRVRTKMKLGQLGHTAKA